VGQSATAGGNAQFFMTDALGSVLLLINGAGQAVNASQAYDPYGNTSSNPNTNFVYAGEWTDSLL
jgi:hypothetical protein